MPFNVSQGRNQRMSFSSSGSNNAGITVTWEQDYYVDVVGVNPATIGAYDVLSAPGIPIVNRTTYATATTIMPYVICRDKSARQMEKRLDRWTVTAKFSTPQGRGSAAGGGNGASSSAEADNQPIPIPDAITDIEPREVVSLGETQRVLWFEKGDFPLLNTAQTPTGNFWAEPVMERMPVFELKVTQIESSITYQDMLDRKFKVNKDNYRGDLEFQWLIEQVEAQEVEITTKAGVETAASVTYTLLRSADETYGWQEVRALLDTQYIDGAGDVVLFQDEIPGTSSYGYIKSDGTLRADQTGEPDYINYMIYDTTPFNDFLQI